VLASGMGPRVASFALACLGGVPFAGGVFGAGAGAWSEAEQQRFKRVLAAWLRLQEDEIREIGRTLLRFRRWRVEPPGRRHSTRRSRLTVPRQHLPARCTGQVVREARETAAARPRVHDSFRGRRDHGVQPREGCSASSGCPTRTAREVRPEPPPDQDPPDPLPPAVVGRERDPNRKS